MVLKPFQHELPVITKVDPLIVVPILCMLENKVDLHSGRVYDADEFEVVEGEWLNVEVAAGLVDPLFVSHFKKGLSVDGFISDLILI